MSWAPAGVRSSSGLQTAPRGPLATASASWSPTRRQDRLSGSTHPRAAAHSRPRELPPFMAKLTTRVYERALVPMDSRERHNQD